MNKIYSDSPKTLEFEFQNFGKLKMTVEHTRESFKITIDRPDDTGKSGVVYKLTSASKCVELREDAMALAETFNFQVTSGLITFDKYLDEMVKMRIDTPRLEPGDSFPSQVCGPQQKNGCRLHQPT